jgi:hypothetical protein
MEDVTIFFQLGWSHIISVEALDHLLFLLALMAVYEVGQWKKVLVLITAFTIGHSATLILSITDLISFNSHWIEFLIPLTILLTAINNLLLYTKSKVHPARYRYFMAMIFGLVHGMGFASTLRFMLASNQSISVPMLSFNLGIEAGQIVVVALLLLISSVLLKITKFPQSYWNRLASLATGIIALVFCVQRWPL